MVDPRWQIAPDPFGWRALASAENSGRRSEGPGSKPPKDQFFLSRPFFSFFFLNLFYFLLVVDTASNIM